MRAVKEHLARMNERVGIVEQQHEAGRASRLEVLNARYDALEARAWLAEEQPD